ncbi:hypothetical protein HanIR_Chr15g0729921 [Helianthus annuus]|nr:hypothetical protein HanIR_Chr15g0729921 [Helianthus annuus]
MKLVCTQQSSSPREPLILYCRFCYWHDIPHQDTCEKLCLKSRRLTSRIIVMLLQRRSHDRTSNTTRDIGYRFQFQFWDMYRITMLCIVIFGEMTCFYKLSHVKKDYDEYMFLYYV